MFAHVKLLNKFSHTFLYHVPAELQDLQVGDIVQVPLQKRLESAVIVAQTLQQPDVSYTIRSIVRKEPMPDDVHYTKFIGWLCYYYQADRALLNSRIRHFIEQKESEVPLAPLISPDASRTLLRSLTHEQQIATNYINHALDTGVYAPTLVHGVTGSGKTEIYKHILSHALDMGKSTILLLPEVTLAVQFAHRLTQELDPTYPIFSFHSATSAKDKKTVWKRLIAGQPTIIIGVHLPILLPIGNLGLIIVDEEHEVGYQEKKHPKINSKEAAIMRAYMNSIPIVLGSATPSITSLHAVESKGWKLFTLHTRFAGSFPEIKVVPLRTKNAPRKHFWITPVLEDTIADRLAKKEQSIIFINRRGHSFFIQCTSCSYIFSCTQCSVSLTFHAPEKLICHYCGYTHQVPHQCPGCKASSATFIKKGVGTQQVVSLLQTLFPDARIARADLDTTREKKAWATTVEKMHAREIDILVGTQTITKGYDFAQVTLVGILWADLQFNFPLYNATETALAQLIQVAGRAGRHTDNSVVIVQSMAEHEIFQYIQETRFMDFYAHEIEQRMQVQYPPFIRMAQIEYKHTDSDTVHNDAQKSYDIISELIRIDYPQVTVLGPAQPPVHMIQSIHSRVLYLKGPDIKDLISLYKSVVQEQFESSLFFTPNPVR